MTFSKTFTHFQKIKNLGPLTNSRECTKRLSSYFKLGRIRDAENLFDKIPDRNVVSWSIMIHGYAKNGDYRKCLEFFTRMRMSGISPNSFSFVGVLVGMSSSGEFSVAAKCVHGLIVKLVKDSNLIVGTSLLDAYARCGRISEACKLFEGLESPSLVSCNAILSGFVCNELFEDAILWFNRFRMMGIVLGEVTVLPIVKACSVLGSRVLCECTHGLVVKAGLALCGPVGNSILCMYSSLKDFDAATRTFNQMQHRDICSWTSMMGSFLQFGRAFDVLRLFAEMKKNKVAFDLVVFIYVVSALTVLEEVHKGRVIHAQSVVFGFGSKVPLLNSLISLYSRSGDIESSRAIFENMEEKSIVSWTAMISAYVHCKHHQKAVDLWMTARLTENFLLDSVAFVSILSACAELAAFQLCRQLHCCCFKYGFLHYVSVQNCLISAYSKCGTVAYAARVFEEMGNLQNIVSWNAVLSGYRLIGDAENAVAIYKEMRKCRVEPDNATYSIILNACSHAGLVDQGLKIFIQMMEEGKINPTEEHFGCIVDLLARAGCLVDASSLASRILEEAGPNVWRALLNGCLLHGNVELGELVARRLFKQEKTTSDKIVLLSNIYASVGRFQDAEVLRSTLMKKGSMKGPATSRICDMPYDFR